MLFTVTALLLTDELEQKTKEAEELAANSRNIDQEKELLLVRAIEDMAIRVEALAAKLESSLILWVGSCWARQDLDPRGQ